MAKKMNGIENDVSEYWKKNNTFSKSIENRMENQPFIFFEGPPTANGLPHAGHVLGRVIKDLYARYKTMQGFYVERKAGWDTHGLPVELGVEKAIGINDKSEIENFGVEKFISKCKESVFNYEKQWREFTESMGYWVDMDNPYKTMDNSYIESVWNILSEFHSKGLLYKGHKVTPYCPSCQTSLSSHEVAQGYKEVKDLSATIKLSLEDNETYLLIWTTTPWTIPGNVAVAVNKHKTYVKVEYDSSFYIVMKDLLDRIFEEDTFRIVKEFKGSELIGYKYIPPFINAELENAYKIIPGDFVTAKEGTGLVHIAPAHGEDDYNVVRENGISFFNVIDSKGNYNSKFPMLEGSSAKESDIEIIKDLNSRNLLFKKEKYSHNYPHCWRCDSPLIYYAMEGWFLNTTSFKEKIIENNRSVNWYPSHIKEGRFGNFLENMVDWNIGRKRYWGTPLNIWKCTDCGNEFSPKSIQDLSEKSVNKIPSDIDLHRPFVDNVKCKCDKCNGEMIREEDVIDVWFDSGSMPFAQHHYPFNNNINFDKHFPADFIAEGIDQTRGWFYSLLVISSMLDKGAPYKNVLSLGHVLDSNGQKMSKSKGNVIDPKYLIDKYGADALRWTLVADSSPWNSKRFSESMVIQTKSKIIDTIINIFSFYELYSNIDKYDYSKDVPESLTVLDEWALSRLNTIIKESIKFYDEYDATSASRLQSQFINEISNWYIRRSRNRFWNSGMDNDKKAAYYTLRTILVNLCLITAPIIPFVSEHIYLKINQKSVHLSDFPKYSEDFINDNLERQMKVVLDIVESARSIRNQINIKIKQPLSNMYIYNKVNLDFISNYEDIIKEELNVKNINLIPDINEFVNYSINLNFSSLGPKLGNKMSEFKKEIENLNEDDRIKLINEESEIYNKFSERYNIDVKETDFVIQKNNKNDYSLEESEDYVVILDTKLTQDLKNEGFVRELIRSIQQYRKELNLPIDQKIDINIYSNMNVLNAIKDNIDMMKANLLIKNIDFNQTENMKKIIINEAEIYLDLS